MVSLNRRLKEIALKEVKHRYKKERNFYEDVLKTDKSQWKYWKNNDYTLDGFEKKIIDKLFTPYEWELAKLVVQTYESGLGIRNYYDAYLDIKFDTMIGFLEGLNRVAVKDIDPKQIHAEAKYRVPKIRIYVESTRRNKYVSGFREDGTGNVVTLIINGKGIEDLPQKHRHLKRWLLSLNEEQILKGV